jgi:UDP-glucuronate 4-epimerase
MHNMLQTKIRQQCVESVPDRLNIVPNGNILVTGGAGFIGMHTCLQLRQNGHTVVALDSLNSYYDTELKKQRVRILEKAGIVFIEGNVCNSGVMRDSITTHNVERIIHLAAQAGVRYSLDHPQEYIQNNIECFVVLLETMVHANMSENTLIYASSSSVYGLNSKIPFAEDDHIQSPNSLYAATKYADEVIAKTYYNLYGIKSVGLRFFTVYGPWGRPDMAYYSFARKIQRNETITIFDHGKTMRDYTYVDDIVQGITACLYTRFDSTEILNLGNNQPVSISRFVQTLERHMGRSAQIAYTGSAKGDVPQTYADITKARCLIGYKPITDIEIGLQRFVAWFKEYHV